MGTPLSIAPRHRRMFAQVAVAVGVAVGSASAAPVVHAQIPAQYQGMDISGPVTVPAGQTTTVDLGVPLNVNVSQNGWTVVSNGTSVSVTAPEGESSIAVPVSYAGQSTTVTIVSQPGGEVGIAEDAADNGAGGGEAPGTNGSTGRGENGQGDSDSGAGVDGNTGDGGAVNQQPIAPRPPRDAASPVDETEAEVIELAGEIDGNVLRSKMSLSQAVNVYNKFGGSDTEGLKLRYLDGDGQIIQGVERSIDTGSRTLTLTYPQDQTPDNPFIIQVVRDADQKAIAIVRITSPGQLTTNAGGEAEVPAEAASATDDDKKLIALGVAALVIVLALIAAVIMMLRKRSKRKRDQRDFNQVR